MHRSALLSAIPLALVALLAGCASSPAAPVATETAAAVTPTPTPTPTPEILLVGAGEKPPTVFGGDCAAALPAEAVAEAVGAVAVTVSEGWGSPTTLNAGGISCSWGGTDTAGEHVSGSVTILPQAGIGDAAFDTRTSEFYFVDCEAYWCAWHATGEGLVITGGSDDLASIGRAAADAQGATVAASIIDAFDEDPWERDRTGWWPADACAQLAAGLGETLGGAVAGVAGGYHDPPWPGLALADIASRMSWCALTGGQEYGDGPYLAEIRLEAGTAWAVAEDPSAVARTVEAPGVTAYAVEGNFGYTMGGSSFVLTDGVNRMQMTVPEDGAWPIDDVVEAAAAWIAATASQL